jgi:hypothetical protein
MGHTSSWHKGSAKPRYLGSTHGMLQQRGCEERPVILPGLFSTDISKRMAVGADFETWLL